MGDVDDKHLPTLAKAFEHSEWNVRKGFAVPVRSSIPGLKEFGGKQDYVYLWDG